MAGIWAEDESVMPEWYRVGAAGPLPKAKANDPLEYDPVLKAEVADVDGHIARLSEQKKSIADHDSLLEWRALVARLQYSREIKRGSTIQPTDVEKRTAEVFRQDLTEIARSQERIRQLLTATETPKFLFTDPECERKATLARDLCYTGSMAVAFNDESYLATIQEHLFGLGDQRTHPRYRAELARVLLPCDLRLNDPWFETSTGIDKILSSNDPVIFVRSQVLDRCGTRHRRRATPTILGAEHTVSLCGLPEIIDSIEEVFNDKRPDTKTILIGLGFTSAEIRYLCLVNTEDFSQSQAGASLGLDKAGIDRIRQRCYRKTKRLREDLESHGVLKVEAQAGGCIKLTRKGRVLWRPTKV
jgi:hypothetical protein